MSIARAIPKPAPPTLLPIEGGGESFPVRRIYCIGRNYGKHVVEMGGDPSAQPPIFFMKPTDAAVPGGGVIPYPPATSDLHHEIELVLALGDGGADVAPAAAEGLIYGFAVGVDLTRRDLQNLAKDKGQPWDAAKGFDFSAPIGPIRPAAQCGALDGAIALKVNGVVRQQARLSEMIWPIAEIISALSHYWRLQAGDLIFTGTPEGVGPLSRGDHVEGAVAGVGAVSFSIG